MTPEERAAAVRLDLWHHNRHEMTFRIGSDDIIAAAIREAEAEAYARGRRDGEWCARHPEEMPTWEGESR
jgi:hypothetical protein